MWPKLDTPEAAKSAARRRRCPCQYRRSQADKELATEYQVQQQAGKSQMLPYEVQESKWDYNIAYKMNQAINRLGALREQWRKAPNEEARAALETQITAARDEIQDLEEIRNSGR
jgi:hypothetical protein